MPTLNLQQYTPCQGVIWSQYRLPFGVIVFAKVCFFFKVTNAVLQSFRFYTDFIAAAVSQTLSYNIS